MVRATFRLPFGGHSPANRDRLCARRDQPQRISPPRLVVASPDRRCGWPRWPQPVDGLSGIRALGWVCAGRSDRSGLGRIAG